MPEPVSYRTADAVAVITIDNPPVNALSTEVRTALSAALAKAGDDAGIRVIVLAAAGRTWPVGADIREFGRPAEKPFLPDICMALAACPKPLIAALHGTALGGGLELALAAACRIAAPGTKLGLPEVALGLLPGAGGTQRLARLIGAKAALGMMLTGLPIAAERGLELGLIDALAPDADVTGAAEKLAHAVAVGAASLPAVPRPDRAEADPGAYLAAVAEARDGLAAPHMRLPAPGRIVDCVEAALLLPEAEGHVYERAAFEELLATPQSEALRHAFLAERRAARPPELAGVLPRPVERIGVIGAGPAGSSLTLMLVAAGYAVTLTDADGDRLTEGLARVAATHERAVQSGTLTAAARDGEWDRVEGATGFAMLARADLVIVAADAGGAEAAALLTSLDAILRPSTVLAVATEALTGPSRPGIGIDLEALSVAARRPDDVLALHLQPPAGASRLVEVASATRTAPAALATLLAVLARADRRPVRQRAGGGFLSQQLMGALMAAMDQLVAAGASPYEVDRALTEFGFARGPYRLSDLAGPEMPGWAEVGLLRQRMRGAGRLCRASGSGFYRYDGPQQGGSEDPEVLALVADLRRDLGLVAQPVRAPVIRRRALAALANEGARLLDEGTARCPADIDFVMMLGFGYPRWRGGPMQSADQAGLLQILNELRELAHEDETFWQAAPLWAELIKNGQKFDDLNRI